MKIFRHTPKSKLRLRGAGGRHRRWFWHLGNTYQCVSVLGPRCATRICVHNRIGNSQFRIIRCVVAPLYSRDKAQGQETKQIAFDSPADIAFGSRWLSIFSAGYEGGLIFTDSDWVRLLIEDARLFLTWLGKSNRSHVHLQICSLSLSLPIWSYQQLCTYVHRTPINRRAKRPVL